MRKHATAINAIAALMILGAGFLIGRMGSGVQVEANKQGQQPQAKRIYTCSMHPQIRLDAPGKCPRCEMPLILADSADPSSGATPSLSLSDHALAMANIETIPVAYREISRELRAVGKVQYNEASLATVTARVDGYAERLFVNVTGVNIKEGDHLAEIYSPELLVAGKELLIALRDGPAGPLVESARLKLRNLRLSEAQINQIAESKKIADRMTLYSPISGTVIDKAIVENNAFKAGDVLYRIANLDTVWIYLDIYEYDLSWVRYGQKVEIAAEACPGKQFTGMVTFVEPVLNEQTRTVRVPVHVENKEHLLKPGMYVSAVIKASLEQNGEASATGIEGKFTCHMHPQVLKDTAGACPLCGMPLEQIPGAKPKNAADESAAPTADKYICPMKCEGTKTYDKPGNCPVCGMKLDKLPNAPAGNHGILSVPDSAVLDSGTRKLVYVTKGQGVFEPREVVLGPRSGGYFPVLKGLSEGELVAARGGFLIDSQFQITGHSSLYYPGGLLAGSAAASVGSKASTMPAESTRPSAHQH